MRRKYTDSLMQWKKNPHRKPLILQGLRQTGKTWLLRDFGSRQYAETIYINLETERPAAQYLSHFPETEDVLLFLETYSGKSLGNSNTLLIFDNIQCVPLFGQKTLSSLQDFCFCHIAAIERGFSGIYNQNEVDIMHIYAFDFEEFLWANSEFGLSREIRNHFSQGLPMGKEMHEKAMAQFRLYLAVGGMPEAVLEYRREKKLLMVPDIQKKLLALLQADIISQAPAKLSVHCRNCWLSVPEQIGGENSKFRYRPVTKSGTARLYQKPLSWLTDTGFVFCSPKRKDLPENPESASFRLYFPDTGLTACHLGIPAYLMLTGTETHATRSCVETALAQQFKRNGYSLSYWHSGNKAQVPFILEKDKKFIAADYRLQSEQKTRNLARLKQTLPEAGAEMCPVEKMILISPEDFKKKDLYEIVPFYAVFCI